MTQHDPTQNGQSTGNADKTPACATLLVDDLPAGDDAFGPHARIAESIANTIQREHGPRAIALRGMWGTGKSTVIKLMRSFVDAERTLIYVFDAWEHQGDPLRRSFLEGLERAVEHEWPDVSLPPQGQKATIETKDETIDLSWVGVGFLLSLLLLPAGIALFNDWLRRLEGFPGLGMTGHHLQGALALALIGLPFVFVVIDSLKQKAELRHLLLRRPPRVTTRIERPWEVSTIEFEDRFRLDLDSIIGDFELGRRLVVVLDNLDRLQRDDSIAAWAALRPLFPMGGGSLSSNPTEERLWLVVPYDPAGMERILHSDDLSDSADHSSVLDKAFQTFFRVPSPAIRSWKEFVLKTLDSAMPEHDRYEKEATYRAIRRQYLGKGVHSLASPRSVKLDINRIGSLHRQWCGAIPLPTIGEYVVRLEKAWERSGFAPEDLDAMESRTAAQLMGLWSGVDPLEAPNLLLADMVESALQSDSPEDLHAVAKAPGSIEIAEHVTEDRRRDWPADPEILSRVGRNLSGSELADWTSDRLWHELGEQVKSAQPSALWRSGVADGLLKIVTNSNADSVADSVIARLIRGASEVDLEEADPDDISEALDAYHTALHSEVGVDPAIAFEPTLAALVAHGLVGEDGTVADALAWLDIQSVLNGTRYMIETGLATDKTYSLLGYLSPNSDEAGEVRQAANNFLRSSEPDSTVVSTTVKCVAATINDREPPVDDFELRSAVLHHLQNATQSKFWKEAAVFTLGAISLGYPLESHPEPMGHTNNGAAELQGIVADPSRRPILEPTHYQDVGFLKLVRLASIRTSQQPDLEPLLQRAVASSKEVAHHQSPVAPLALVGLSRSFFADLDDEVRQQVGAHLVDEPGFRDLVSHTQFKSAGVLVDLVAGLDDPPADLCEQTREHASNVSADVWAADLEGSRELWGTLSRIAVACGWQLSTALREGIERYAHRVASAASGRHDPLSINGPLDPRSRTALQHRLWNLASDSETDVRRFIGTFGDCLAKTPDLAAPLSKLLNDRAHELVGAGDTATLHWLADAISKTSLSEPGRTAALTSVSTRKRQEQDQMALEALDALERSVVGKQGGN